VGSGFTGNPIRKLGHTLGHTRRVFRGDPRDLPLFWWDLSRAWKGALRADLRGAPGET
jgi:hypothetical protein